MKAIEKAKIALRKYLLKNKEQVKLDLDRMRLVEKQMINISGDLFKENGEDISQDDMDKFVDDLVFFIKERGYVLFSVIKNI